MKSLDAVTWVLYPLLVPPIGVILFTFVEMPALPTMTFWSLITATMWEEFYILGGVQALFIGGCVAAYYCMYRNRAPLWVPLLAGVLACVVFLALIAMNRPHSVGAYFIALTLIAHLVPALSIWCLIRLIDKLSPR
ncbi:MAG: hypothetical protein H7X89_11110 [Rhizobiales bacterium]|nr:hypothetical protein [Hyphomicrobiales bacterium]